MKMKKPLAVALGSTFFVGLVVVGLSIAWFSPAAQMRNEENPIEGVVQDKYYNSGDGLTPETAFEITQPRHLYNLAWLQYLGFYNKNQGIDNHQFYFKLGNNVDMSQFGPIPPIGTEDNPFVGNFDGHGYVISGVTVSNDFDDYVSHPSAIDDWDNADKKQPHILGLFGIVGDYTGGNKPTNYSSEINEFVNTGVSNATIKTVTNNSLMGIAAGYVKDSDLNDDHKVLENVVVDSSTIELPESGATTSYGNDVSGNPLTNISDYTLVGYTNVTSDAVKATEDVYGINVDTNITYSASETGTIDGWGGSINMLNLYDRIVDIRDSGTFSSALTSLDWKKNHVIRPGGQKNVAGDDTITVADSDVETTGDTGINVMNFKRSTSNYYKAGNYVTARRTSTNARNYNYLLGGTFNVYNYQKLYHHDGHLITVDGEHYLTSTSPANNGLLTSAGADTALIWTVPASGTTGKIYATYDNNDYYLTANGNSVILRTGSANGTTWEIDRDIAGHVRYVYNGNYLTYENGTWKMAALPTVRAEPTDPIEPIEPIEPTEPTEPQQSDYSSHSSEYQISYNGNYLKYTGSGNGTFSSGYSNNYWHFSDPNGTTTKIYVTIGNTNYYVVGGTSSANATFSTSSGSGTTFTKGGTNQFYYRSGSRYYYLTCRNYYNTLYITRSGNNAALNINTATSFTITPMSTILYQQAHSEWETEHATWETEHVTWETEHGTWETEHATWETEHANYPADHAAWEAEYAAWVTQMNNLHPIVLEPETRDGPDIDAVYAKTEYGMEYKSDDTSFFPLNVDKDDEETHTKTTNNISDYYPKSTNTGYITIGSSFDSSSTELNRNHSTMRVSRYNATASGNTGHPNGGNIYHSFKTGDTSLHNVKTINAAGNVIDVTDSVAETFEQYSDTKSSFESILTSSSALDGTTRYLYGLHFMGASISMDHILNADWVSINGQEKTNYDLPVNGIDFNLKEAGYITFFAGSYFDSTVNSFFSLHKVVRSGNRITNILEIEEVLKDTQTTAPNHAYVYKLKDSSNNITYSCPYSFNAQGTKTSLVAGKDPEANNLTYNELPSGYKTASSSVFLTSQIKINSGITNNREYAFYFEIPMNAGEFCLGSVPGGVGGYLLYLDIGANAAKTNRTIFYDKFVANESSYTYPVGVSLVAIPELAEIGGTTAFIDVSAVVDDSDSACMVIKATATGSYGIDRNILDNGGDEVTLDRSNTALAPPIYAGEAITKVHEDGSSTNIELTAVSSNSYTMKRVTYYDYIVNSDTLYVTTVCDRSDGLRTITQSLYNGQVVNSQQLIATYVYDGTNATSAQLANMKIYNSDNHGIKFTTDQLLDRTEGLVIADNKMPGSIILSFKIFLNGSGEFNPCPTIVANVDSNNNNGKYYLFENYVFEFTSAENGSIIKVTAWNGTTEIYFATYAVTSSTQTIVINL